MIIIGAAVLYFTRGEGHGMTILIGTELLMVIIGTVLGIISTGIIIILLIIVAGIGVIWARRLITGGGGPA
jgi:hypothetical protein